MSPEQIADILELDIELGKKRWQAATAFPLLRLDSGPNAWKIIHRLVRQTPMNTWIIAPDAESLRLRWRRLIRAKLEQKEELFHPHLRDGEPGDKHVNKVVKGLPGTCWLCSWNWSQRRRNSWRRSVKDQSLRSEPARKVLFIPPMASCWATALTTTRVGMTGLIRDSPRGR